MCTYYCEYNFGKNKKLSDSLKLPGRSAYSSLHYVGSAIKIQSTPFNKGHFGSQDLRECPLLRGQFVLILSVGAMSSVLYSVIVLYSGRPLRGS